MISIVPDEFVAGGWAEGVGLPAIPLVEALQLRVEDGDAFAFGYHLPGGECPRLKLSDLEEAEAAGVVQTAVFVDLDLPGHVHWPSLVDAREEMVRLLHFVRASDVWPAAYTTRAGLRLVVALQPVPIRFAAAATRHVEQRLASALAGWDGKATLDPRTLGGHWWRPYRLPFVNRGAGLLDAALDVEHLQEMVVPPEALVVEAYRRATDVVDVREAPTTKLPPHWQHCISKTSKAGQVLDRVLAGQPLGFEVGSRNTALLGVVRSFTKQLSGLGLPPEELATQVACLLQPSVEADTSPGAPTVAELRGMAGRAAPLDAVEVPVAENAPDLQDDGPLIVSHPTTSMFWIRRQAGGWSGPWAANQAVVQFRDEYPEIPAVTQGGSPYPVTRLLYDHGTAAREVVYVRTPSKLDDGRLYVQLYADRPVVPPRYHAKVDTWLKLLELGCPGLRQWLSWVDDLSVPLPALVIYAPRGVGKGMLANALATYFGGSYTSWTDVVDTSHGLAPLLRSPLVYADEIAGFRNVRESSTFRSLVGNTQHQVNEKNVPVLTLNTAVRFIAAMNTDSGLAISGRHSAEDIQAILARILTCVPGDAPAKYLNSLGDRAGTFDWVVRGDGTPGLLVEHLAWLQTQRPAVWSGRWPVQAHVHPEVTNGSLGANTEALAIWWAVATALWKDNTDTARIHEPGVILVYPPNLAKYWSNLTTEQTENPGLPAISAFIRSARVTTNPRHSVRLKDGSKAWMSRIDADQVLVAAEALGLSFGDDLRDKVFNAKVSV